MAFGRRGHAETASRATALATDAPPAEVGRIEALRDLMIALLATAGRIADAVRDEAAIPMPPIAEEPDPEAGPLALKGLCEHFFERKALGPARLLHPVFGYGSAQGEGALDTAAQLHLLQLMGRIMTFNLFAQRAHMDEALGVALQAPSVPALLDEILARSAFFAAYFDNLHKLRPETGPTHRAVGLETQRANIERHLLMARDKMLAPDRLEAYLPAVAWPFMPAERLVEPHGGDYFINGIYCPAAMASALLASAALSKGPVAAVA